MQRTIFDSLDELAIQPTACTFEPIGDQSTALDAAAELAAFIARPDRAEGFESDKQVQSPQILSSTGLTPFAEAAGTRGQP